MRKLFSEMAKPRLRLVLGGLVAALYAVLTLLFAPISYGPVQFRLSEALTVLPVLFPQAIPGLALGCLIANLIGSATPWDVVFGTLATLLAAFGTRLLRKNLWLAALSPVVLNSVIVGFVLHFSLALPLLPTMGSILLGEAVVVYVLGIPLLAALRRLEGFTAGDSAGRPKDPTRKRPPRE